MVREKSTSMAEWLQRHLDENEQKHADAFPTLSKSPAELLLSLGDEDPDTDRDSLSEDTREDTRGVDYCFPQKEQEEPAIKTEDTAEDSCDPVGNSVPTPDSTKSTKATLSLSEWRSIARSKVLLGRTESIRLPYMMPAAVQKADHQEAKTDLRKRRASAPGLSFSPEATGFPACRPQVGLVLSIDRTNLG
mmetsp:Transcript_8890/g.20395  ORF Transcript_8890/g.20395 Transcript_8890/m.20395 type:complete len:191 (-) Transcript_8890:763-1335(-)